MSSTSGSAGTALSTDHEVNSRLSRQLHQTTQPLAVLQGVLELSIINSRNVEDYRRSVELALVELERVTDCFNGLRTLIENLSRQEQDSGVNHV